MIVNWTTSRGKEQGRRYRENFDDIFRKDKSSEETKQTTTKEKRKVKKNEINVKENS